jgi:hypothetical protein
MNEFIVRVLRVQQTVSIYVIEQAVAAAAAAAESAEQRRATAMFNSCGTMRRRRISLSVELQPTDVDDSMAVE